MKQARALLHVRQTKSDINFRIICDPLISRNDEHEADTWSRSRAAIY